MRVTNSWIVANTLRNLNNLRAQSAKAEQQVSTGLRFTKVSEDPVAGADVIKLKHRLGQLDQWEAEQVDARQWLRTTEESLSQVTQAISRLKELALAARNTTASGDRDKMVPEVQSLLTHILDTLNGKQGDASLFAGYQTGTQPFVWDSVSSSYIYQGDAGQMTREVGPGMQLVANITGNQLDYSYTDSAGNVVTGDNVLNAAYALVQELTAGQPPSDDTLARLDAAFEQVNLVRAEVGARDARIEQLETKLQDTYVYLQATLSDVQGADPAKAILELQQATQAYQSALMVTSRTLPVTLADFLR
jgi:flagellar hook-associated protein 3 FlgL